MSWLTDLLMVYNDADGTPMYFESAINVIGFIVIMLVFLDAIYIMKSSVDSVAR